MKYCARQSWLHVVLLITALANGATNAAGPKSHRTESREAHAEHKHQSRDGEYRATEDGNRDDHKQYNGGQYFHRQHRTIVRDYYIEEFNHNRCPPGLRKKHNGCLPPGLAKQWHLGKSLARDVIIYDLPQTVVVRLGPPPVGYRYGRVGSDILLLAVGTNIVLDAIADLSAM
jgi:Ni/Co efflux regulator RcnB